MARIRQRRMFWESPVATDVEAILVYAEKVAAMDNATFIGRANTNVGDISVFPEGGLTPHVELPGTATEYYLAALEEDTWQFAVVARDDDGNYSDVYQHPDWVSVPLDVTPPDAPFGGGLE